MARGTVTVEVPVADGRTVVVKTEFLSPALFQRGSGALDAISTDIARAVQSAMRVELRRAGFGKKKPKDDT